MAREIKFRAWDKVNNKMIIQENTVDENRKIFWKIWETTPKISDPMQFTGLLDKNGKEVYEGDILMLHEYENVEMPVVFHKGSFCIHGFNWWAEKSEVIGNIHENPNLIEQIN